jgi:hypothetical protein
VTTEAVIDYRLSLGRIPQRLDNSLVLIWQYRARIEQHGVSLDARYHRRPIGSQSLCQSLD